MVSEGSQRAVSKDRAKVAEIEEVIAQIRDQCDTTKGILLKEARDIDERVNAMQDSVVRQIE